MLRRKEFPKMIEVKSRIQDRSEADCFQGMKKAEG